MNLSSRSVLFELLYAGLIEIRAASGGSMPMTNEDRELVNAISGMLHNLPHQLEAAASVADFDRLLDDISRSQRPIASEWVAARLSGIRSNGQA